MRTLLRENFGVETGDILRTDNGKPYLSGGGDIPLFFSVSHTDELLFIAFSDENVGIDAESLSRKVDYLPIVRKFSEAERREIVSPRDFLRHFTVKEAAVKWLGGTLARDMRALRFEKSRLYYGEIELPAAIAIREAFGHVVAVCSERDFSEAEFLPF